MPNDLQENKSNDLKNDDEIPRAAVGQKIRLKYEMLDGEEILPVGTILYVTVSNSQGLRASGDDGFSRIFRHDCYEIVPPSQRGRDRARN